MNDRTQRPTESNTLNPDRPTESDRQLEFLEELIEEHATVAGDIIEIDSRTWAIHGVIAVDGDVIMAEYDSEEHARTALGQLGAETRGHPV
jgi:hypothetical protein